jgi:hypothetical protein
VHLWEQVSQTGFRKIKNKYKKIHFRDWMAEFKSRFIAEKSYYEENAKSEDASVTHLRKLLRSENSAEIIAELDALFSDYITGNVHCIFLAII